MVKISDFGSSKLVEDGNSPALTEAGTRQYWAPEVADPAARSRGYTELVDLWSLGVVLYVMVEGMFPFNSDHNLRLGRFVFRDGSATTSEARSLMRALIQVRPDDRLPLSSCLEHPWVVIQRPEPIESVCSTRAPP